MPEPRLIYSTWPNAEAAGAAAAALVEEKLAACVTVLAGAKSVYRWQGQVRNDDETVMLAKTTDEKASEIVSFIIQRHPYDLPCIISLSLNVGESNPAFLQWIINET